MRAKRIIHVANFGFTARRNHIHHTSRFLSQGFILAGHDVKEFSDRDIAKFNSFLGIRDLGKPIANKMLIKFCEDNRPDVLVFGFAEIIKAETIATIREKLPNVKIIQYNDDLLALPEHKFYTFSPVPSENKSKYLSKKDVVDVSFSTTGCPKVLKMMADEGCPTYFMPNLMDISVTREKNFEKSNLTFDNIFVVSNQKEIRHYLGDFRVVDDLYDYIKQNNPSLNISAHGVAGGSRILGPDYQDRLAECACGMNLNIVNDVYLYSSNRLAHLAGNGVLPCLERASGYGDIFAEDEMLFYSSKEELLEKLSELKLNDNKRKLRAEKCYNRYYQLFNNKKVAQYMLDVLYGETEGNSIIKEI